MPAQRSFYRYPEHYADYIRRAAGGEDVVIEVPTDKSATISRNELYNYRYSLRDEVKNNNPDPQVHELQRMAERLVFSIEDSEFGRRIRIFVPKGLKYL